MKLTAKQVAAVQQLMEEKGFADITLSQSSTLVVEAVHRFPTEHWIVASNGRVIDISYVSSPGF